MLRLLCLPNSFFRCFVQVIFLFVIFCGVIAGISHASAAPLKGAVCVIRHGDKVVMVLEEITGKLALPGGYISQGDTPQQAAIREVFEETGINVQADRLLQQRGSAAIYACVSQKPIPISPVSSFNTVAISPDTSTDKVISSWFAKHFGKETKRVYLLDPNMVPSHDYRYPNDVALLADWLPQVPESPVIDGRILFSNISGLHQQELQLITQFHSWIKSFSPHQVSIFDGVLKVMNLPGEHGFIFVLILFAAVFWGPKGLLNLAVVLLTTIVVASLVKFGLASPRPFYIWPELQQANASGFGLPSGHTLMATVLWGLGWYYCPLVIKKGACHQSQVRRWRLWSVPLVILAVMTQAVARVWYGVHFISDTLLGAGIGITLVTLFIVLQQSRQWDWSYVVMQWQTWLIAAMVLVATATYTQVPQQIYLLASCVGITLSLYIFRNRSSQSTSISVKSKCYLLLILLVGVSILNVIEHDLLVLFQSSVLILVVKSIMTASIAIWCVSATKLIYDSTESK